MYRQTYCCYVTPDKPTPIPDCSYDVLLCSAGMFPGSIVPQAFTELIRVVRPGGVIAWNIADGYEVITAFKLNKVVRLLADLWGECPGALEKRRAAL